MREAPDGDMERHTGPHPVCVGQWCCGCSEHPVGKPWGWAAERWEAHYESCPRKARDQAKEADRG
jgi:hypothetical protein